jgi:uncharacterized protein YqhQ
MTNEELKLPSYGGQAIIEGVLMRGSHTLAAAMRDPEGNIVVETESLDGIYTSPLKNIPFLRGLILLWDALGLGMRFLTLSANLQTGEDEKIEGPTLYLTLAGSLAIAIGLFFIFPAALSQWIEQLYGWSAWRSNILEGGIRLGLMIGYIWAIGLMPDIQRVFAYHGAEHKTINAYEANAELTPYFVSSYSREHPRCGTAFLLTLMILSIIIFTLMGPLPMFWRIATRVLFIPILAGIAYEYLRWTANHLHLPWVKLLTRPNMALQRLTTREPDLEMLEVSLAAFNAMLAEENRVKTTVVNHQQSTRQSAVIKADCRNQ